MLGGLISAGLGIASMFGGNKSAEKQTEQVNEGYDYLKDNSMIQGAQQSGEAALNRTSESKSQMQDILGTDYWANTEAQKTASLGEWANFETSPGYQWRLSEGLKGVEASAAASGLLNSGSTAKALVEYNQNFASNEYANWLDQYNKEVNQYNIEADRQLTGLSSLASMDENSRQFDVQTGVNAALGVGSAGADAGMASAQVESERSQNWASSLGGIASGVASIFGF